MAFEHPLAQYLSGVPGGQNYVRPFDTTGKLFAKNAPYRQMAQEQGYHSGMNEEMRLADQAWAGTPEGARYPVRPTQRTDTGTDALLLGASMLPGAGLAEAGIKKLQGQPLGFADAMNVAGDIPGAKVAPLLGALFGTPKRYLFHGRSDRTADQVKEAGGSAYGLGSEINTPNTSYAWDPQSAYGFTGRGAGLNNLTQYEIKDPSRVRNLRPSEFVEAYHETQSNIPADLPARGNSNFPTEGDFDDMTDTVGLYSFPNVKGFGHAEREIAAARNIAASEQNQIDTVIKSGDKDEIEAVMQDFHDPVLTRAKAVPEMKTRARQINKEASARNLRIIETFHGGPSSGGFGMISPNAKPVNSNTSVEWAPHLRDISDAILDHDNQIGYGRLAPILEAYGEDIRSISPDHDAFVTNASAFMGAERDMAAMADEYYALLTRVKTPNNAMDLAQDLRQLPDVKRAVDSAHGRMKRLRNRFIISKTLVGSGLSGKERAAAKARIIPKYEVSDADIDSDEFIQSLKKSWGTN